MKPYISISYEKQREEYSQAWRHLGAGTSLEYLSLSPHADEATWRQGGRMITEPPWQRAGAALASDITLLSFIESTYPRRKHCL